MKVLMVAPQPFLEPRGTPISVYQRVRGLASLGHSIDLLTYHVGRDVHIPGVRVVRIPSVPFIKEVKVGPSWKKPLLDFLLFWRAIILLITRRYDVIHSHEEAAFFCTFLAAVFRVHHIYDMHSSLPRQLRNFGFGNYWPLVRLFEVLERWTLQTCAAVITIGVDLEAYVRSINPAAKIALIENLSLQDTIDSPNTISVAQLRARLGLENKQAIVYTGTLERYQGVDILLESAQLVSAQNSNVAFLLVGGKPRQIEHWKTKAQQLGLNGSLVFIGAVPVDELESYLMLAEILLSPRIEGTSVPLKIYTYLLSGKPIVATNLLAHTLVLNPEIALLVEPTKEALAMGITRLLEDVGLRQRLGQQALRYAKDKYNPVEYLAKLEAIYHLVQAEDSVPEQSLLF